jgi:hypothetical protein
MLLGEVVESYKSLLHSQVLDLILVMYHSAKKLKEPHLAKFHTCLTHLNATLTSTFIGLYGKPWM